MATAGPRRRYGGERCALITRLALACAVMAVCVAVHASGLVWAIGWLRRRPARLPGFAPHSRLLIVMANVDRPRLRIPDAQQGARTPPGRRVISLGADPSGRLVRWRNRAGHGGGDRQPRVLRSDGDSERLQLRPVHGLERPSLGQLHQGCTNRSSRAISSLAFKTCLQPPIIPSTRSGGTRSPDWSPAVDAVVHSRPKRRRAGTSTTTAQVTGDRAETRAFARKNWFASSVRFSSRYGFRLSSPGSWQRCFARANPTRRSSSEHRCCGCNSSRCCFDRNWTESTKTG